MYGIIISMKVLLRIVNINKLVYYCSISTCNLKTK